MSVALPNTKEAVKMFITLGNNVRGRFKEGKIKGLFNDKDCLVVPGRIEGILDVRSHWLLRQYPEGKVGSRD